MYDKAVCGYANLGHTFDHFSCQWYLVNTTAANKLLKYFLSSATCKTAKKIAH